MAGHDRAFGDAPGSGCSRTTRLTDYCGDRSVAVGDGGGEGVRGDCGGVEVGVGNRCSGTSGARTLGGCSWVGCGVRGVGRDAREPATSPDTAFDSQTLTCH